MAARIVLLCEPESFRFERRVLNLNTPIRVGRACNRNQSSRINANFDCKVLSRNHALLSYEDGRFFIQVCLRSEKFYKILFLFFFEKIVSWLKHIC